MSIGSESCDCLLTHLLNSQKMHEMDAINMKNAIVIE